MRQEEGQSCHDEDYDKRHYGKVTYRFQRTSALSGMNLFCITDLQWQPARCRKETAQNKLPNHQAFPEISIITQTFEPGTVVSARTINS